MRIVAIALIALLVINTCEAGSISDWFKKLGADLKSNYPTALFWCVFLHIRFALIALILFYNITWESLYYICVDQQSSHWVRNP